MTWKHVWPNATRVEMFPAVAELRWDTTDNFPPNDTVDSINGLKQEWKNESGDSNSSKNPIKTENIDTEISGAAFANTYSKSFPKSSVRAEINHF